jgi:HEPN domain-containing protein
MSLTLKKHVDYWVRLSNESLLDMRAALRSGRRTNALFCGHIALEKSLKAVCAAKRVPQNKIWGHNLMKLADAAGLWDKLSEAQQLELATITTFNIEARYDDYKRQFHNLCTKQYTKEWASKIEGWCKDIKLITIKERALLPNNTPVVLKID